MRERTEESGGRTGKGKGDGGEKRNNMIQGAGLEDIGYKPDGLRTVFTIHRNKHTTNKAYKCIQN